ncbi:MAG: 2-isopropylmalate synthase [Candidatus Hydrogenedentes bacterium]|nr:2-isopropylmalate synthase [Candidatus Hydrogenedentota bacterium]
MEQDYVCIWDTTLRDGEQTPGVHMTVDQKAAIAERLERIGVDTIEAGFPASSPGDFEAVRAVANTVRHCEVAALARCVAQDIDRAAEALRHAARPVIHVVLGVSDIHLEKKLRMDRCAALRAIADSVARARKHVLEVEFSAEDATRADRIFLRQCVWAAVEAGATRINIADTAGCATPEEYGALVQDIVAFVEGRAIVSAHCHDDLGMATANTIAAVRHGAGQAEVAVNGIGERAGNTSFEEVAAFLAMKKVAATHVDLTQAASLSAFVAEVTGIPVPPNRAIVGANAFAHSSGIHQDGILKDPATYAFVTPEAVGVPGHRFVLTARSGRSAVAHGAARHGYVIDGAVLDTVYDAFVRRADAVRGAVSEEDLVAIVRDVANSHSHEHTRITARAAG